MTGGKSQTHLIGFSMFWSRFWFWMVMMAAFAVSPLAKEYIIAVIGQDVILPCKVSNNNKPITAVEWSRPGLDPEYVLLYRDERFDVDNQHPSYQNRVDLQDKDMKDGDFSLVLKDVKMEDTGRYNCYVSQGETTSKTIYLEVYASGKKTENPRGGVNKVEGNNNGGDTSIGERKDGGNIDGIVVGAAVCLILLLAVALVLICRRPVKNNLNLPSSSC